MNRINELRLNFKNYCILYQKLYLIALYLFNKSIYLKNFFTIFFFVYF